MSHVICVRDCPAAYAGYAVGNRRGCLTMQPNPLDPVARERLSRAGKVFTFDLRHAVEISLPTSQSDGTLFWYIRTRKWVLPIVTALLTHERTGGAQRTAECVGCGHHRQYDQQDEHR